MTRTKTSGSVSAAVEKWRRANLGASAPTPPLPKTDPKMAVLDEIMTTELGRQWIIGAGSPARPPPRQKKPGVVGPLPRRKLIGARSPAAPVSISADLRTVEFHASFAATLIRVFYWVWAAVRYGAGTLLDAMRGQNTVKRRAIRLREIFESLGATFIKLGQQLAVRADVLPYEYCEELSKMLDAVPPFPPEQAIAAVERHTGKPITETFEVFDPDPIGSASLSCVYQAVRHTGEKVAVKVRRPGIGPLLAADLKALDWMMRFAEEVGILREGMTVNLRQELHTMLMEELNFWREARYTELFRRRTKKQKQRYITAPKVHFDISGEDVLVTELVSGVFLWEILSAVETEDHDALARLKAHGIDPIEIAKNLSAAYAWETLENLLFHADPHPANLIAQPGNRLVFIDFGSCGHFTAKTKRAWNQLFYHIAREDVQGLVAASISVLEPLPPIDVHQFTKEVEALYWDWMYAVISDHAEWWERASGMLWMKLVAISRKYNIPVNLDTLRMFRATFLYDTIIYRLWSKLDARKQIEEYNKDLGKRTKRRVRRNITRRLSKGLSSQDYIQAEELARMGQQIIHRLQYELDRPRHEFAQVLGKAAFSFSILLRILTTTVWITFVTLFAAGLSKLLGGPQLDFFDALQAIIGSVYYQIPLALVAAVLLRKTLLRVSDPEIRKGD